jgi:hypothetical protein
VLAEYDTRCREHFENVKVLALPVSEIRIYIVHEDISSLQLIYLRNLVQNFSEVGNILVIL